MHAYYMCVIYLFGQSMLIVKHTIKTNASSHAIWHIWQDVANWNTWDHGIEFSTIDGPFEVGTKGTLKPKGGPLVHTQLTFVEPPKHGVARFVDEAKLPGTRIIVEHSLVEINGKTFVTHRIEMHGLLAFFFAFVIGREMKKNLPREMLAMVQKAETLTKSKL